jgi:SAM-dependent methyltransferase
MVAGIWTRMRSLFGAAGAAAPPALAPDSLPSAIGRLKFAPAIDVALEVDRATEDRLLARTGQVWKRLGEQDPHWSVLTWDRFRKDVFGSLAEVEFYRTGASDFAAVEAVFGRTGQDFGAVRSVVELGCGAGRVTEHFARAGRSVVAFDISEPHLALARARLAEQGLSNVEFVRLAQVDDIRAAAKADLVYTVIVLQHNPPPVQYRLLSALMDAVAPGGYIYFQVPTYMFGYRFEAAAYQPQAETMEMHCVPMDAVLALLRRHAVDLLDVFQDDSAGSGEIVSHTFFARKRA